MKNRKALILLLTANAISGFAQGISMLAIPWYFAHILKDGSSFGVVYAVTTLLTLFWSLYAGTLVDKFSRKTIFLTLSVVCFVLLSVIASSGYYFGQVPIVLIALAFCATIFNYNLHYPTLYAMGQEMSEVKNYGKTNSLIEIIGQSTSVFSGVAAAILLTGINFPLLRSLGIEATTYPRSGLFKKKAANFLFWKCFLFDFCHSVNSCTSTDASLCYQLP